MKSFFERITRRRKRRLAIAKRKRRLWAEPLESRCLLTATPFGATPQDTAEYLLGDVHVTVVLPESNGAIDADSENWTAGQISEVKSKLTEAMNWWPEALERMFPETAHSLDFHMDFTFTDTPFSSSYEPISRVSNDFELWMGEFLAAQGHPILDGDFTSAIRAFNHDQRVASGSDWAFTVFVVNNANDSDKMFASGGDFRNAFAFAGGQFIIGQVSRPASTFAHEVGHIFYAFDEYFSGEPYSSRRGYLNVQNLNGLRGHPNPDSRVTSIMDSTTSAYPVYAISPSAAAMVGWQDSDSDGVFDILDVPHSLAGSGWYDVDAGIYRFIGSSSVQPLQNRNPWVLSHKSDITLNEISRAQYRIDGGQWMTAQTYGAYTAELDLSISAPPGDHTIEIRTLDDATGVASNIFEGSTSAATATTQPGVNGFLWTDVNENGQRDLGEPPLARWEVQLQSASGAALDLIRHLEPDDFANGAELNNISPDVRLSSFGTGVQGDKVYARERTDGASTGTMVFAHEISAGISAEWTGDARQLLMEFTDPVNTVSIDAVSNSDFDYGRLTVYNSSFQPIERVASGALAAGEVETLAITRPTAEIAFAIATGHGGTAIRFDNLRFGASVSTVTDDNGAFAISGVPAGSYTVAPTAPVNASATSPPTGSQAVTLTAGEALESINFGFVVVQSPWHNPTLPEDVSAGDGVGIFDVLLVIRDLRENGIREVDSNSGGPPYLDVDNDFDVDLSDVLAVVRYLRNNPQSGGNEPSTAPSASSAGAHDSTVAVTAAPVAEGEPAWPMLSSNEAVPRSSGVAGAYSSSLEIQSLSATSHLGVDPRLLSMTSLQRTPNVTDSSAKGNTDELEFALEAIAVDICQGWRDWPLG